MPHLVVTAGPHNGLTLPLHSEHVLGRDAAVCSLVLDLDDQVSRQHARLAPASHGAWLFRDLGSANGSWLLSNGRRRRLTGDHLLQPGDLLELGSSRLRFDPAPAPAHPAASPNPTLIRPATPAPAPAPLPTPASPAPRRSLLPLTALALAAFAVLTLATLAFAGPVLPFLAAAASPTLTPASPPASPAAPSTPATPLTTPSTNPNPNPNAPLNPASCDERTAAQRVGPSVVWLLVEDPPGQVRAFGSGFAVTTDGYIVTNRHVVTDQEGRVAPRLRVIIPGRDGALLAQVVRIHDAIDLALIKTSQDARLTPISWARSARLPAGERVLAVGFPLASNPLLQAGRPTFTAGIVSDTQRVALGAEFIQHSAQLHGGNSGGPLVTLCGDVIGINTLSPIDPQSKNAAANVSFAIASDHAERIVDGWVPKR